MMHGPFNSWAEAVAKCCTRLGLIIVSHDEDEDGRLYVATVPHPAP